MDEAEAQAVGPPPASMNVEPELPSLSTSVSKDKATKSESRNQKKIWLLTYYPPGTYITAEMLKDSNIIVDECHSTCDRIINFTYIHLPKRCRLGQIEKFLEKVKISHKIAKAEVYGYDPIGSQSTQGTTIQDHVVFKMLLKHLNEGNKSFLPWTNGENVLKKGHLFEASGMIGETTTVLENQTKSKVIAYARELEEKVRNSQGFFTMYIQVSEERSSLFVENASLKRKVERMEEIQAENAQLKQKLAELSQQ